MAAVAALAIGLAAPAAAAPANPGRHTIGPPAVNPALLPVDPRPVPPEPTEQRAECARPRLSRSDQREPPRAQQILDLPAAWRYSQGAGQKVAVIDTGVNRHPRLHAVQPGGDFVGGADGTADCDGHGTLVAGIIASAPSPDDGFAGVAPEATILAVRQLSLAYEPKDRRRGPDPAAVTPTGTGTVHTLAAAVVHTVNLGATVVNISQVACATAGLGLPDGALGAAVKYAYDRNVVVVAAAGNVTQTGPCAERNTGSGWRAVRTVVSPAWYSRYVLTVASVDSDGAPSELSMPGPWVSVAAPGRSIVSLDSAPGGSGLVDSVQTRDGSGPIEGTSFATAFVSGLAALVRARFPALTAQQVMDRITRTAHSPGTGRDDQVGHGLVDPVAALTAELPDRPTVADRSRAIPAPPPPPAIDPTPRRVATAGSIACLLLLALGAAAATPLRHSRLSSRTTRDVRPRQLTGRSGQRRSGGA
ncbi:MAG: type VII secretion-associated serine protease mycosin [Mycobacteriaceae bacterium]|nr:type VII secretion-associated serine protease mycosin [Mycobacteriaceae bacterium]